MIAQSPIIACVGDKGSGKTLFLTFLAYKFHEEGLKVYANFKIIGIKYNPVTFRSLADLPDELRDGVILLDEAQMGLDAYRWFDKQSTQLNKLQTQLRKRNLEIVYTTQRFPQVNYRLRSLTDYIFLFQAGRDSKGHIVEGTSLIQISDRSKPYDEHFKEFVFDGRGFFNKYDTEEVIENE